MATSGRKVSPYRRGKENHGGSTASIQMPGFWERHFWLLACGVVLISVIARVFDFSIAPPGYDGLVITEPFCGLHSWDLADRAWAARSHVKYGLGYTKGLRTLVVGNPPPEHPQYDVSEPPLETWILAAGMLLLGTEDWSVRLFEVLLAVPCLFLILLVLRKLYGGACALLTGLLLVLMPLSGYFGFNPLMVLLALWALYEYLLLTGRLGEEPTAQGRHLLGLAVALFVIVQVNWVGVFYAFVIGVHYVVRCLIRQQVRWKVMTALALPSLLSLALSISMMAWGFRNNIAVEAATRPPAEVKIDRGKLMPPLVYKVGPQEKDTAWGMMKTLYQWRSREGELASFSWRAWVGQNLVFAYTNFTAPILLCLAGYLLYLLIAHLYILDRQVINPPGVDSAKKPIKIPYSFTHMWFFLLPALLFLFTFKGLFWKHQYWQAPFALFVALGAAWGLLLLCEAFEGAHRWFGKSIVAFLIVVIAIFGNQGLASYRAVRWHSPRTIELFKQLNKQIPPDKGLLTFKDFVIQQNKAKVASYREEYAWYLDREMAVANAWQYEMWWAQSAKIEDAVNATVKEVWRQAQTGCFARYLVPAREEHRFDPLYREEQEVGGLLLEANSIPAMAGIQRGALGGAPTGKRTGVTSLKPEELDARLNDADWDDDQMLFWEKHRRYREALIARLRGLYPCQYFDNRARPGDEDFCYSGITPCYLFDLTRPLVTQLPTQKQPTQKRPNPKKIVSKK